MDGRADVVGEAGERQLGRSRTAANGVIRLQDRDVEPRAREDNGGGKTVRSRPNDNRSHSEIESVRPLRAEGGRFEPRTAPRRGDMRSDSRAISLVEEAFG